MLLSEFPPLLPHRQAQQLPAEHIVDFHGNMRLCGKVEFDCCRWIKRVGIILSQGDRNRYIGGYLFNTRNQWRAGTNVAPDFSARI